MNSGESGSKDGDKRTPWERFRDLARRVVNVPKGEVDRTAKRPKSTSRGRSKGGA
jgi:hypothetical protein